MSVMQGKVCVRVNILVNFQHLELNLLFWPGSTNVSIF